MQSKIFFNHMLCKSLLFKNHPHLVRLPVPSQELFLGSIAVSIAG